MEVVTHDPGVNGRGHRKKMKRHKILAVYLCDHFTTFTRPNLGEELQNQNFGYIPGEVPHIPAGKRGVHLVKAVNSLTLLLVTIRWYRL